MSDDHIIKYLKAVIKNVYMLKNNVNLYIFNVGKKFTYHNARSLNVFKSNVPIVN